MKHRFFAFWVVLLAVLVTAVVPVRSWAQSQPQPAVVVSLAGINEQLADVEHLMNKAGFAQFAPMLKFSAAEYIRGLDADKPIGVMLFFEDGQDEPKSIAFVPVTNLKDVLDMLADFADIKEGEETTVIVMDDGTELTVKQAGGYAFVSEDAELLSVLPSNPAGELGDLPNSYNLAARVYGQRIPDKLRDKALELIREGFEAQLEQIETQEPELAQLQRENFDLSMTQFEAIFKDTDELVAGLAIDKDSGAIHVDVSITGLPNTRLARQFDAVKQAKKTRFGGFVVDDAAFNANISSVILPEESGQYQSMLESLKTQAFSSMEDEGELSDQEREMAKGIINDLFDVINQTLSEGTVDAGAVLYLDAERVDFAMGMQVADAKKIENSLKTIAEAAQQHADDHFTISLDDSQYEGVKFHKVQIAVPESEEEARKIFGEKVTVAVGIGDKSIYLGAGQNPTQTIQQAMDRSKTGAKDLPPMQYNIYVGPILAFAASLEEDQTLAEMAKMLAESGNDRIRMSSKLVENGQSMRIEFQDGLLKLIGLAAQQFGGAFGGEDF